MYFLLLCVICLIPGISPWPPITMIMPVVFVLGVTLIREGIEDYYRYLSDEKSNNQPIIKMINNEKKEFQSK